MTKSFCECLGRLRLWRGGQESSEDLEGGLDVGLHRDRQVTEKVVELC